ncbi:proprotein convertase [Anaeramoeba flamelloides]|uniref:Proprotein convertase n=1 Tax=Anaeramoeba flamelloides TaxID=1746091 RepID=A0ABQ8Y8X4_9EUKA|nr:proprotein convertase [Anaeramoeba flamelloides]
MKTNSEEVKVLGSCIRSPTKTPKIAYLQNYFAHFSTQSDSYTIDHTPIWEHGITGQNQVVGIGDTGVDTRLCMFYDNDTTGSIPYDKVNKTVHRTFNAYYLKGGKKTDVAEGHGTFITATVLGNAIKINENDITDISKYNGMAPDSKCAFTSLESDENGDIVVPEDIDSYFQDHYNAGARIHLNPWVYKESNEYDSLCKEFDQYSYDNKDFLIIVPAGNYGEDGFFSTTSPSIAKNVLSVGAALSSYKSFETLTLRKELLIRIDNDTIYSEGFLQSEIGPYIWMQNESKIISELVETDPENGCSTIVNNCTEKIVLVLNDELCDPLDKIQNAQDAGALAIIVVQGLGEDIFVMETEHKTSINIPSIMVDYDLGMKLKNNFLETQLELFSKVVDYKNDSNFQNNNLANFSSLGPSSDGRIHPLIIAPGDVLFSSKSKGPKVNMDRNCDLTDTIDKTGTSVSSAIIAGSAILVRQYFVDGFYPTGFKNSTDSLIPSSALLKAMIINSARIMDGKIQGSDVELSQSIPSIHQGYGHIQLDQVLYFGNSSVQSQQLRSSYFKNQIFNQNLKSDEDNFNLFISDDITLEDAQGTSFCINVQSTDIPLKITLVWTDPPGDEELTIQLVNNLDLVVLDPNGKYILGNMILKNKNSNNNDDEEINFQYIPDELNNVEQIWLRECDNEDEECSSSGIEYVNTGKYIISIIGTKITTESQAFSLVITGDFSLESDCEQILCPNNCGITKTETDPDTEADPEKKCELGICVCDTAIYHGNDCGFQLEELFSEHPLADYVQKYSWNFYKFEVEKDYDPGDNSDPLIITVETTDEDYTNLPKLYIKLDEFPGLADYDKTIINEEKQIQEIKIKTESIEPGGIYYIGVYGFCCEDINYNIEVTFHIKSGLSDAEKWAIIFAGFFILFSFLIFGICLKMKDRDRQSRSRCNMDWNAPKKILCCCNCCCGRRSSAWKKYISTKTVITSKIRKRKKNKNLSTTKSEKIDHGNSQSDIELNYDNQIHYSSNNEQSIVNKDRIVNSSDYSSQNLAKNSDSSKTSLSETPVSSSETSATSTSSDDDERIEMEFDDED